MIETRYSYLTGVWRRPASDVYVAESPESAFERHLQELFLEGQKRLHQEEYVLALQAFQEAMALILHTAHPTMPIDPNQIGWFEFPFTPALITAITEKAGKMLVKSDPRVYQFPQSIVPARSELAPEIQKALAPAADTGLQIASFHSAVNGFVQGALEAAASRDWRTAARLYQAAVENTPGTEEAIRGGLLHDLAIVSEMSGDAAQAQESARASIDSFARSGIADARAQALATSQGIFSRVGDAAKAVELGKELANLKSKFVLGDVVTRPRFLPGAATLATEALSSRARRPTVTGQGTITGTIAARALADTAVVRAVSLEPDAPELMGTRFIALSTPQKSLAIRGGSTVAAIGLDAASVTNNLTSFLKTVSETADLGLLHRWLDPIHFVAYIPHMYFFVLPMSVGDCYTGMGNLDAATTTYASVLPYPFINKNVEIVKLWTRMARTYLDLGDQAYRNARDNAAAYQAAKSLYGNIVLGDRTLNAASPLYADAKFGSIKGRVAALLAAPDPLSAAENPSISTIVLDALSKLSQIEAGLNFFGYGPDYAPPFSFEYLQATARYFSQQAAQIEQRYIQYKSQAENEEFRREQLDQQAEVARQTVVLEERGVAEAQLGISVANASVAYAALQTANAQAAKTDFDNARWELLELSTLEAWASASSVDRDDQVKLTITGYEYYGAESKRRNVVLKELAAQRTLLSHELEAAKLDRAIASAQAYQNVAQAQVAQAGARLGVAQQRVAIAQLQQRQAEENRDFLDMREFGARLWYELAREANRIKRRYLDMATSAAFLMERAYNAETERGLSVIRYDYQSTASGNLMGADMLLADIDSFTFDHVTTSKTKKNPVKRTISLADAFPTQFRRLRQTGRCTFETTFAEFDRQHPGLYLAKLRNVEILFVGLGGTPAVAGTLRNIGVSRFRSSGGRISTRVYPSDVMVLSQYQIRQDALAFRFNPNDLRLFENNGIETMWQLDLPLDANDLDYDDILDVQLSLYYDGFFDPALEGAVRTALPSAGAASRAVSMRFSFPDELFYLRNRGEAELSFGLEMFPRFQKDQVRTTNTLMFAGDPQTAGGLTLRIVSAAAGPAEIMVKSDASGMVDSAQMAVLDGKPVADRWSIAIRADDNPHLVKDGALDLGGLGDVMAFFEYTFVYR
jgi:hypothetical protein